jgi:hypothetical protein
MTARPASTRLFDLGSNPKGVTGSQSRRIRATKGKFGPASKARQLTDEERRSVEDQLRRAGQLGTVP